MGTEKLKPIKQNCCARGMLLLLFVVCLCFSFVAPVKAEKSHVCQLRGCAARRERRVGPLRGLPPLFPLCFRLCVLPAIVCSVFVFERVFLFRVRLGNRIRWLHRQLLQTQSKRSLFDTNKIWQTMSNRQRNVRIGSAVILLSRLVFAFDISYHHTPAVCCDCIVYSG